MADHLLIAGTPHLTNSQRFCVRSNENTARPDNLLNKTGRHSTCSHLSSLVRTTVLLYKSISSVLSFDQLPTVYDRNGRDGRKQPNEGKKRRILRFSKHKGSTHASA